ncbi:MAG: peptidoglycan hydrolase-like protein with peptidoglycan-binding domain [Planctomycetota bacterium]|jgi:peptidoglycan hydrolase-like protein with peptidoglycan-binding domain
MDKITMKYSGKILKIIGMVILNLSTIAFFSGNALAQTQHSEFPLHILNISPEGMEITILPDSSNGDPCFDARYRGDRVVERPLLLEPKQQLTITLITPQELGCEGSLGYFNILFEGPSVAKGKNEEAFVVNDDGALWLNKKAKKGYPGGFDGMKNAKDNSYTYKTAARDGKSVSSRKLVGEIQGRLRKLGYDPGPVDGVPGEKTHDAAREYRDRKGMRPTGELSKALLDSLRKEFEKEEETSEAKPAVAPMVEKTSEMVVETRRWTEPEVERGEKEAREAKQEEARRDKEARKAKQKAARRDKKAREAEQEAALEEAEWEAEQEAARKEAEWEAEQEAARKQAEWEAGQEQAQRRAQWEAQQAGAAAQQQQAAAAAAQQQQAEAARQAAAAQQRQAAAAAAAVPQQAATQQASCFFDHDGNYQMEVVWGNHSQGAVLGVGRSQRLAYDGARAFVFIVESNTDEVTCPRQLTFVCDDCPPGAPIW